MQKPKFTHTLLHISPSITVCADF